MSSNFTYMRKVGEANLQSQKIDQRLPLAGTRGLWGVTVEGYRVSVFEGEKVLKMNGGGGCKIVYLMQLNCVPKND